MTQSTYLGYMATPSGKRLVVQAGTHAFTNTAAVSVTLVVSMRRVVSSQFTPQKPQRKVGATVTSALGAYPYILKASLSANTGGMPQAYRILVQRKVAGNITKFGYMLTGY
jgi:hypothetical protein